LTAVAQTILAEFGTKQSGDHHGVEIGRNRGGVERRSDGPAHAMWNRQIYG